MSNENISSAEMTAFWRCHDLEISNDMLSVKLASADGIKKAHEFEEKYGYSLIGRKISVRAGWCLEQAVNILQRETYDSCISLGSGFSLLTYCIALAVQNKGIKFIDTDLQEIIRLREERIKKISTSFLNIEIIKQIKTQVINLERAYQEGKKFKELFPSSHAPVFIMEGIIYFLTKDCIEWIYNEIFAYNKSIVIFDYWPEGGQEISQCFKRVLASLNNFIPEQVVGLMNHTELTKLCHSLLIKEVSLQDVEHEYAKKTFKNPQLINNDDFIPVKLVVAGK